MRKANKYNYFRIIQGCFNGEWCDESHYETDSTYWHNKDSRTLLKNDLNEYRNCGNGSYRVINRKELKEAA